MLVARVPGRRPAAPAGPAGRLLAGQSTLLVADAHFGKAVASAPSACRCRAAPRARRWRAVGADRDRRARRVVFLGDFLHSARSHAPGDARRLRALARARTRGSNSCWCAATTTAVPAIRRPDWASRRRRAARAGRLRALPPPAAAPGPTCWPAICIPAAAWADAPRPPAPALLRFGDDGRRAAGLRRLHRHAQIRAGAEDRVFVIADDAVARAALRRTLHLTAGDCCAARGARGRSISALFWNLLRPRRRAAGAARRACCRSAEAPDWSASIAFRYRKRGGPAAARAGAPCRADPARLAGRGRGAEGAAGAQHRAVRRRQGRQQRAADRRARHRQSSLIKACLNEFAPRGLRLIEVDKSDLVDLPDLVDLVAERPERFIVFCDDLSFDEGEPGYKALKSILDGSVAQASENVLIYATSNRRHLLPEYMKENLSYKHTEDGEVHPGEVVEEKISLSERFGLWVSFYPFSQDEYLAIVAQWLRDFGVDERPSRRAPGVASSGRSSAARARAGSRSSSPGTTRGGCVSAARRPRARAHGVVEVAGRAHRRRRPLPADQPARRQGLRRLLGVPGRQARARRDGRRRRCARELHEELGIDIAAVEPWKVEIVDYRACPRAPALLQGVRLARRVECANARPWPGICCR